MVLIARAVERRHALAVPAGAVGQVWRDGRRQARLARLLGAPAVHVEPLDDQRAREAGQLCGVCGTTDVIDASVVLCARARGHAIVTSDSAAIRRLDGGIPVIACSWIRTPSSRAPWKGPVERARGRLTADN